MRVISGTSPAADGDWSGELTTEPRIEELLTARHQVTPRLTAWTKLQHGTVWYRADSEHHGLLGDGDALVTTEPGLVLATRTADCVPIFITGTKTIALVHAGMAGAVQEILPRMVEVLATEFDEPATGLSATVGPFICARCYTVSPNNDVLLADYPDALPFIRLVDGTRTFDLAGLLTAQAKRIGVGSFSAAAPCTHHDPDLYSSRHGHSERLLSYLMIEDA